MVALAVYMVIATVNMCFTAPIPRKMTCTWLVQTDTYYGAGI